MLEMSILYWKQFVSYEFLILNTPKTDGKKYLSEPHVHIVTECSSILFVKRKTMDLHKRTLQIIAAGHT